MLSSAPHHTKNGWRPPTAKRDVLLAGYDFAEREGYDATQSTMRDRVRLVDTDGNLVKNTNHGAADGYAEARRFLDVQPDGWSGTLRIIDALQTRSGNRSDLPADDAMMEISMRRILGVLGAMMALSAPSAAAEEPATIRYCHGYGCKLTTTVRFSPADMAELKSIVRAGRSSAEAERKALGRADQWYERLAGVASGTSKDKPKATFSDAYDASQLDCIDESRNTTTLLKLIEKRGWLSHHVVGKPKHRGFLLDLRYPHNTATVTEKESGEAWAIDSWVRANAEVPDIMPLKIWVTRGVGGQS